MKKIFQSLFALSRKGERCVLVTVLSHTGSTPRSSGAKMIIQSSGNTTGTIGGGLVEAEIIKDAEEISRNGGMKIRHIDLKTDASVNSIDVVCGGRMTLLIESVDPGGINPEIYENLLDHLQTGEKSFQISALPVEDTMEKMFESMSC